VLWNVRESMRLALFFLPLHFNTSLCCFFYVSLCLSLCSSVSLSCSPSLLARSFSLSSFSLFFALSLLSLSSCLSLSLPLSLLSLPSSLSLLSLSTGFLLPPQSFCGIWYRSFIYSKATQRMYLTNCADTEDGVRCYSSARCDSFYNDGLSFLRTGMYVQEHCLSN